MLPVMTKIIDEIQRIRMIGLVKKSQNVQVHTMTKGSQIPNHVYDGLGCLPGIHHTQLKENAVPSVHAALRVPFALRGKPS